MRSAGPGGTEQAGLGSSGSPGGVTHLKGWVPGLMGLTSDRGVIPGMVRVKGRQAKGLGSLCCDMGLQGTGGLSPHSAGICGPLASRGGPHTPQG